jgi:hypothetical protein
MLIPPRPSEPILLCYDRSPSQGDPNWRFRSTSDLHDLGPTANRTGLAELRLSGSASLSLPEHMAQIKAAAKGSPVIVVDLREESHAIVDQYPATWMVPNDWSNIGRTQPEVLHDEQQRIAALKNEQQVVLTDNFEWKTGVVPPRTVTQVAPVVQSEQALVEGAGCTYVRLAVTDHLRPTDEQTDRFIDLVRGLPEGTTLHVHCKGGMGRTTTFMAMYDMLRNARHVGAGDIIDRQKEIGFGYDLRSDGLHVERRDFKEDRRQFIRAFHTYAQHNPGGLPLNWSQWLAQAHPPEPAGRAT